MATTPKLALPYPIGDDTVDPPRDIRALAEKLDTAVVPVTAGDMKLSARVNEHGYWIKPDGRALPVGQYPELRAALLADGSPFGTTGSDPRVPDMRGRDIIGAGAGSALTARTPGQTGGAETHALTTAELASHAHTASAGTDTPDHTHAYQGTETYDLNAQGGVVQAVNANYQTWGTGGASARHSHSVTVNAAGGGGAHNNMPPFVVAQWFVYAGPPA